MIKTSATAAVISTTIATCSGIGNTTQGSNDINAVTPSQMSKAGVWTPAPTEDLTTTYRGTLANTFSSLIKIGTSQNYSIAITGWGYQGWDSKLWKSQTSVPTVNIALLEGNGSGKLTLNTSKYIADTKTAGAGSMVVTDINSDGYQDFILVPNNETPIYPAQGAYYLGSAAGSFTKRPIDDSLSAHDAKLVRFGTEERIFTAVTTSDPRTAYYKYINGEFKAVFTANISHYGTVFQQYGNMSQALVRNAANQYVLATSDGCEITFRYPDTCPNRGITVFQYDGDDISGPPVFITPYLVASGKYKNYISEQGKNQAHVYRLWSLDLNKDGNEDILAAQSMWLANGVVFPTALQILQNDGSNKFTDKTDLLNLAIPAGESKTELDYNPTILDVDGSGIETLFFGAQIYNATELQTNYLILNDGTGRLYAALNPEFLSLSDKVNDYLVQQGNQTNSKQVAKFFAIPQTNGNINFVAMTTASTPIKNTNQTQISYIFVNTSFWFNQKTDFKRSIQIQDRNKSRRIRTWAGNDVIQDTNANGPTTIDGGLGVNKSVYSGPYAAYSVARNANGTISIVSPGGPTFPAVNDILTNIQVVTFPDKTINF